MNKALQIFLSKCWITTTASLVGGGANPAQTANTEQYDGSAWTEVNNLNGSKSNHSVAWITNCSNFCRRISPTNAFGTNNESWDGTNWTETTELSTSRINTLECGAQTLQHFFGGDTPQYRTL